VLPPPLLLCVLLHRHHHFVHLLRLLLSRFLLPILLLSLITLPFNDRPDLSSKGGGGAPSTKQ
jgi:hypothetical protein